MKKFTAIIRDENENLTEGAFFAETSKDIKELRGFVTITKSERVKHPSPEVMQRVLLSYQMQNTAVNLAQFYTDCDTVAAEIEKPGAATE